ncbi:MAG: hypothetical protein NTX75_05395 [Proteobacteria bacterium]|nr:hypothetical protein [Pseudomonadota bacterium]
MSDFTRIKDVETLERYENKLKDLFEKVIDELRGTDLPPREQEIYDNGPHARFNPFELRSAIDALVGTLKDIKKIAK